MSEPSVTRASADLARRVHETLANFGGNTAKVASIVLAEVPGGGTLLQLLGMAESHDIRQRICMLEAALEQTPEMETPRIIAALGSATGRSHVRNVVEQARRTDDADHMRALANAFVSGLGLQAFAPPRAQVLDDTLRDMTAAHVALLRHGATLQRAQSLSLRFERRVIVRDAAAALGIAAGLAQKLAVDLEALGVVTDPTHNRFASHWGLQAFALTSFGLDLARYIESPEAYLGSEPPPMESIDPPHVVPVTR